MQVMNLVDVASAVVLPAMRAVFKDDEISAFESAGVRTGTFADLPHSECLV